LVLGLLFFAGCGASESVSGIVTVDGQPLPKGRIRFIPREGTPGPDAGDDIVEGKYHITKGLQQGEYRVEINGTRKTPKKVRDPFFGVKPIYNEEEVVHPDYNQNSKLIYRVNAGANVKDFEVKGLEDKRAKTGK
jgi:hypothetical protein